MVDGTEGVGLRNGHADENLSRLRRLMANLIPEELEQKGGGYGMKGVTATLAA